MKSLLLRKAALLPKALLVLTFFAGPSLCGIQTARAQGLARQLDELERALANESQAENYRAIEQLSKLADEKASELLLKALKNNLRNKRGHEVRSGSLTDGDTTFWTSSPPQNGLLTDALGSRKYKKALPTLRRMLKLEEKRLGFSKEKLAANIYLISPRRVEYRVEGELRIYPEQKPLADAESVTNSLSFPAGGEAAWREDSLNGRVRDLVRVLGSSGGPAGFREPSYRALKEDVGLATLFKLAKSDDPLIRPYAVEALGILGGNSEEIMPVLTAAIRDRDPRVRLRGVRALGHLLVSDTKPEEAWIIIGALKTALGDAEAEVRNAAIEQFGNYSVGHRGNVREQLKDVVPRLISALDDGAGYVRTQAAFTLGRIGPLTPQVIPSLVRLLKSPAPHERERAAEALSYMPHTSLSFVQSGERAGMEKVIGGALLAATGDTSKGVRYEVAVGLGAVGPVVNGVVPALIRLTRDPARGVRTAAALSLGKIQIELPRIIRALTTMLKVPEEDAEVIESALRALGEIGVQARSAAPEVIRHLKSENPRIREHAAHTLERIGGRPLREAGNHR